MNVLEVAAEHIDRSATLDGVDATISSASNRDSQALAFRALNAALNAKPGGGSSVSSRSHRLRGVEAFNNADDAQYLWHGVSVQSSASKGDELDTMLDLVGALAPADRALIGEIYCNSAAGHCSVHLRRINNQVVGKIAKTGAAILFARFGSVRSMTIEASRPSCARTWPK